MPVVHHVSIMSNLCHWAEFLIGWKTFSSMGFICFPGLVVFIVSEITKQHLSAVSCIFVASKDGGT